MSERTTNPPEVIDLLAEVTVEREAVDALVRQLHRLKDEGNAHFQAGQWDAAVDVYQRALGAATAAWRQQLKATAEAKAVVNPLLVSLHANLAAAHLARAPDLEAPLTACSAAESAASAALHLNADHVKALYRRGLAREQLGSLAGAREDLHAACRADPRDRNARAAFERVQAALRSQRSGGEAAAPGSHEERDAARQREQAQVRAAAEAAVQAALTRQ